MASKAMTVKQAGRKGGQATAKKWKNDKRWATLMRKKLRAAGKKGATARKQRKLFSRKSSNLSVDSQKVGRWL
ncbi:hypothetical protein [Salinivibrio kushneri]|uniref:hypothetical protein n=1 Tax=Salinivibrio kushneri TaxID=1908198 RepID=UPI0022B55AE4|nr:hypothetical protein [Salinivibrio kushneri]WBA12871.1 hypothetical protein O4546_06635 [Salinivibrio kushneri]